MDINNVKPITFHNAHLKPGMFKNFSGIKNNVNRNGERNFCLELDDDTAIELKNQGWNVRFPEDDRYAPHLPVAVRFDQPRFYPKVFRVTSDNENQLDEETISGLDRDEIEYVDITIRPRFWEKDSGEKGIKAYVQTMFVHINEDELMREYGR